MGLMRDFQCSLCQKQDEKLLSDWEKPVDALLEALLSEFCENYRAGKLCRECTPLPLKNDGWKSTFLLGWSLFRVYMRYFRVVIVKERVFLKLGLSVGCTVGLPEKLIYS